MVKFDQKLKAINIWGWMEYYLCIRRLKDKEPPRSHSKLRNYRTNLQKKKIK
jgi:hypothetical protein